MEANPLKRRGQVEDVVEALDYLLTQQHVTGRVLFVDGGEHADWPGSKLKELY
ncbi:MAG: hypothetical protein U0105_25655 [Candidatus Obscuribacterales bacterium]